MIRLDENSISELVSWLDTGFLFRVVSQLNTDFRRLVYKPDHNRSLFLDFSRIHELESFGRRHSSESSETDLLHLKLWKSFSADELFGDSKMFSQLEHVTIKFKFDQNIHSRDLEELAESLRRVRSIHSIELISPPVDFLTDLFTDLTMADCYCLDEDSVNCVDERLETYVGEGFFPQLESLVVQEAEIDSFGKIFNYNIFVKFKRLKEVVFNEIYSVRHSSTASVFSTTPRSRSMSMEDASSFLTDSVVNESLTLPSAASPQVLTVDPFWVCSTAVRAHPIEVIDLYMIPFNEAYDFVRHHFLDDSFPNLKTLRIRCISSTKHCNLLTSVMEKKFNTLPSLEEIEIGSLTKPLVEFLTSAGRSLRKLSVTSRMDLRNFVDDLWDFATTFPLEELNIRISKSVQLDELAELIDQTTFWRKSLKRIKINWNLINSMSIETLVFFRHLFRHFDHFIVSACGIVGTAVGEEVGRYSTPFEMFYYEFCEQRIFCHCTECLDREEPGEENELHLRRLALEEWETELSSELKQTLAEDREYRSKILS
jgi:hypothetical protein